MFDPALVARKSFALLGLGEVLLRLSPPNKERILAGEVFEKRAGGSELNVVSGVSLLGLRTGIITRLPENEIGKYVRNKIRNSGVSDDYVLMDAGRDARLGVYYFESGAAPRKPTVVYDRAFSSFTRLRLEEIPAAVFGETALFHTSGITLGLGEELRAVTAEMLRRFKAAGALISFDVNFRAALWAAEEAREAIEAILPLVDILFASEESLRRMFQRQGEIREVMAGFAAEHGLKVIASSRREVISPTRHNWNSLLYLREEDRFYEEEPYREIEVVDRIGSGDAYLAGTLFGFLKYGDAKKALEFGNAMGAVKNTIPGDMPVSDFNEISQVIRDHQCGDRSEMKR